MGGRTSAESKNRYNLKSYDRLNIVVPKGRKEDIGEYAQRQGTSVNGLVNGLLRDRMGMSEEEWQVKADAEA